MLLVQKNLLPKKTQKIGLLDPPPHLVLSPKFYQFFGGLRGKSKDAQTMSFFPQFFPRPNTNTKTKDTLTKRQSKNYVQHAQKWQLFWLPPPPLSEKKVCKIVFESFPRGRSYKTVILQLG